MGSKKIGSEELENTRVRELKGIISKFVFLLGVAIGLYQLVVMAVYPVNPWILRGFHLGVVVAIGFLIYSGRKKNTSINPPIYDILIGVLLLSTPVYIFLNYGEMLNRIGVSPTAWDVIFGVIATIGVIEITRRSTGWALPILVIIFLGYAYLGNYMPESIWHQGYSFERIISYIFSMNGIYSIPLGVAATYVFLFMLFGSFLEISGAGKFFIDISYAFAGRFRGGPAKVSVLSSALMGTVNGTAVANVATTGAFTIPLMKRVGYKAPFAGAVEAVASSGGQILPPVMGAGAFIMADMTGIPYSTIIIAAIIPAVLYFVSVLFMVDFEAGKMGLKGLSRNELPNAWKIMKTQGYLLVPLLVMLFSLVVLKNSPIRAALFAIGTLIVLSWFSSNKIGWKEILIAISNAMKGMVQVTAACASAGVIIGVFSLTGLGAQLAQFILSVADGTLWIGLICVMALCILLGMGLPTVAAYALAASTVAPPLIEMGVPDLTAHLFIFYFACISTITPPVALSAFAAAAIAKAPPMTVGWKALKLGITAFIVPFLFVMDNGLLAQGPLVEILQDSLTALLGVMILASSTQGFIFNQMTFTARIFAFICAIMSMIPIFIISIIGLVAFAVLLIFNKKGGIGVNRENLQKTG